MNALANELNRRAAARAMANDGIANDAKPKPTIVKKPDGNKFDPGFVWTVTNIWGKTESWRAEHSAQQAYEAAMRVWTSTQTAKDSDDACVMPPAKDAHGLAGRPTEIDNFGQTAKSELKVKRAKLRGLIKYHNDQNKWLLSRRGIESKTDLAKVAEYERELSALGNDEVKNLDLKPPTVAGGAKDAEGPKNNKPFVGVRERIENKKQSREDDKAEKDRAKANDKQKPYISKLGNKWQLLDENGKVVREADGHQVLQQDLDRLLASRDACLVMPPAKDAQR